MTKLQKAIYYAEQQVKHGSIYVWSGQGQKVNVLSLKNLARMENSAENAARVAKKAYAENTNLKEACMALGYLTEEQFDEVFHPEQMV